MNDADVLDAVSVLDEPLPTEAALAALSKGERTKLRSRVEAASRLLKLYVKRERHAPRAPGVVPWRRAEDAWRRCVDLTAALSKADVAEKDAQAEAALERARKRADAEALAEVARAAPAGEVRFRQLAAVQPAHRGDRPPLVLGLTEGGVVYGYDPRRGGWVPWPMAVLAPREPTEGG